MIKADAHPDDQVLMASEFKSRCLALLDWVERTERGITITKHGRPVARLVPIEQPEYRSTFGAFTILTDNEEELFSAGEVWEVDALPDPVKKRKTK